MAKTKKTKDKSPTAAVPQTRSAAQTTTFHIPFLVQRLKRRLDASLFVRSGVDNVVDCDYMGAAEFEWGVLGGSLRQMRAEPRIECFKVPAAGTRPELVVISLPEDRDAIIQWFEEEMNGVRHNMKEATYLRVKYDRPVEQPVDHRTRTADNTRWTTDFVGWWAVNGGDSWDSDSSRPRPMSWAVFDDVKLGEAWYKAMRA